MVPRPKNGARKLGPSSRRPAASARKQAPASKSGGKGSQSGAKKAQGSKPPMKKKQRRDKKLVDEIAATIILQEYMRSFSWDPRWKNGFLGLNLQNLFFI